jgi:hypothetical protein
MGNKKPKIEWSEEDKKRGMRNRKILLGIFAALIVLPITISVLGGDSKPKLSATATPLEVLESNIKSEAGDSSNIQGYKNRIQVLTLDSSMIYLEMNGDDNLTEGTIKSSNRRLVLDAIRAIQNSKVAFDTAVIAVRFPLVDNLGNTTMDLVLKYGFSAGRLNQINTANIDTHNMDVDFADISTIIHPSFEW